jgi:hypothetical protein
MITAPKIKLNREKLIIRLNISGLFITIYKEDIQFRTNYYVFKMNYMNIILWR